ncbi:MAG: alpha/beta hydrolase fold domain-containing protein [Acidobacteriota bacterium]
MRIHCALVVLVGLVSVSPVAGQATAPAGAADWAAVVANDYRVTAGLTYLTASNWEAKLDLYRPATPGPHPTVLHIHGGGWTGGSREGVVLRTLPYLQLGFAVVNISYRLARVAPAPAAVEDALCALRWIARSSKEYSLDTARIVVTGYSAGGHLALTTGMVPPGAGLDRQCPGPELPKVAGIINWYGITDVADLLDGPNMKAYAVAWLGSAQDREAIAKRLSPLTYVRRDVPPVLTIHGDADPTVPYAHATRLHAALRSAGAASDLITVPKGLHGGFPQEEQVRAFAAVREFLARHRLLPTRETPTAR